MKYTAIKGIQAGKEYFTIMVKLKELEILFPKLEEDVLPEKRAQRKLNQKRIPAIKRYIVENLDTYVFSALAGSVDGKIDFTSFSDEYPEVGILEISDKATFLINDGQHRKTAIIDALKECPALADETIPVVLFKDMGLKRSQQMFTDLNKHAVKTSNSLSELYDSTDKIAAVTRNLLEQNEFIGKYTDKEKDNLSMNSAALFTFNTFYKANKRTLVDLYFNIKGKRLPWDEYRVPLFSADALDIVKQTCEEFDIEYDMLAKLVVAIENNKHYTRGQKVNKAFDKVVNEGWLHYENIKKAKEDINNED